MLEILAVRLKVLSLLGSLRLREKAAAAVVLPGVRNPAGGGGLPPCSETPASVTRHWRPLSIPCKTPIPPPPWPACTRSLSSCSEHPSLLPTRPRPPPLSFVAPSALASPCSPSMSCLIPYAIPLSYCTLHSPLPPRRPPPPLISCRSPSHPPFPSQRPPMALPCLASTAPDLGLHVCKSDTSQLPLRWACVQEGSAGEEPGVCKSWKGRILRRGACLGGRRSRRGGWRRCLQHSALGPSASPLVVAAPLPHGAPTSRYWCSSLLPLSS